MEPTEAEKARARDAAAEASTSDPFFRLFAAGIVAAFLGIAVGTTVTKILEPTAGDESTGYGTFVGLAVGAACYAILSRLVKILHHLETRDR